MEKTIPVFNNFGSMIPPDSWEDYFFILSEKNVNRLKSIPKDQGCFANSKVVHFIIAVCDRFKYNREVKHTAITIFDSFMLQHIETLHNYTYESSSVTKLKDWQILEDKIGSQMTLRILSCIQIASKLQFLPTGLSVKAVREFMRTLGLCYSSESVFNSELRVLRTLDYKLNIVSPLVYIETLLKLLNLPMLNLDHLYYSCVQVLDFVVIERDMIYKRLIETTHRSSYIDRQQLVRIQNDYMLLSSTVITAASYISLGFETSEKIAITLHNVTRIAAEDITDFCNVIVNHISFRGNREN